MAPPDQVGPGIHPDRGDGDIGVEIVPQPVDEQGKAVHVSWGGDCGKNGFCAVDEPDPAVFNEAVENFPLRSGEGHFNERWYARKVGPEFLHPRNGREVPGGCAAEGEAAGVLVNAGGEEGRLAGGDGDSPFEENFHEESCGRSHRFDGDELGVDIVGGGGVVVVHVNRDVLFPEKGCKGADSRT